jgi:hypothetical protein
MYFNKNGNVSYVNKSVIDKYLNKKRKGNVIYCLQYDDSYFTTNERFATVEDLNKQVAKYMLKGYKVYYYADNRTDKRRSY